MKNITFTRFLSILMSVYSYSPIIILQNTVGWNGKQVKTGNIQNIKESWNLVSSYTGLVSWVSIEGLCPFSLDSIKLLSYDFYTNYVEDKFDLDVIRVCGDN